MLEADCEIDKQLGDNSGLSSPFSSDGETEYHPSSDSNENTNSNVCEDNEHNSEEIINFL